VGVAPAVEICGFGVASGTNFARGGSRKPSTFTLDLRLTQWIAAGRAGVLVAVLAGGGGVSRVAAAPGAAPGGLLVAVLVCWGRAWRPLGGAAAQSTPEQAVWLCLWSESMRADQSGE